MARGETLEGSKRCYFICCTLRSGSYLLAEALTNTGLAGRPGEHFTSLLRPWNPRFTVREYRALLQPVLDRGTVDGIFGTKVLWPWFEDFTAKLETLAAREETSVSNLIGQIFPNPRYIMLTRRDKVRQVISFGRAVWTNVWRSTETAQQKGRAEDLHLDPRAIDGQLAEFQMLEASFERYFHQQGIQPFRVVYEELVDRYEETALAVLDFLGIPHPAPIQFGPRILERQWDAESDRLLREYYAAKGVSPIP